MCTLMSVEPQRRLGVQWPRMQMQERTTPWQKHPEKLPQRRALEHKLQEGMRIPRGVQCVCTQKSVEAGQLISAQPPIQRPKYKGRG